MAGLLSSCLRPQLSRAFLVHACRRPVATVVFRNITLKHLFKKKDRSESMSTAATAVDNSKPDYEVELEKFTEREKYVPYYGYDINDPDADRIIYRTVLYVWVSFVLTFVPIMLLYSPDIFGRLKKWTRREAVLVLEERIANGKPLLDANFAPPELIENMIPPPGDWEEEWLRNQPAVRSDTKSKFYTQAPP